jgi:hypothetical protein
VHRDSIGGIIADGFPIGLTPKVKFRFVKPIADTLNAAMQEWSSGNSIGDAPGLLRVNRKALTPTTAEYNQRRPHNRLGYKVQPGLRPN